MIKKYILAGLFCFSCLTGTVAAQEMDDSAIERKDTEPISISLDIQHQLRELLPNPDQIGGQFVDECRFYGENLWEYINGAAESFHAYDFVALVHQDYQIDDSEVTVDIYDMGNSLCAFGMYASERSPDYHFLDIGAEGYGDELGLNFFQNRYYVKLSIFSESDTMPPLLVIFAEKISKKIGMDKSLPEFFKWFPVENRIAHSEQVMLTAPLGHAFLSPVFSVQYQTGQKVSTLLVADTKSEEQAIRETGDLADHFKQTGNIEKIPDVNTYAFRSVSTYQTETIVVQHNHFVFILKDPPDNGMLFLQKAMECIDKK